MLLLGYLGGRQSSEPFRADIAEPEGGCGGSNFHLKVCRYYYLISHVTSESRLSWS